MKTFEGENYYQILNVAGGASAIEIRRAYLNTLEIYKQDSIATYSLFSTEQREVFLQIIEKAFDTLIDEDKRAAYNQMLVDTGQVDPVTFFRQSSEKPAAHSDNQGISKEKSLSQWVQKKSEAPEIKSLVDQIHSKELLSGQDLKHLRETLGIEIQEIYAVTRISSSILNMIEADRFDDLPAEIYLKQFLKSYAEILQIDPRHVVEGYFKLMGRDAP
ncbi:MAG: helix-turn-helix domain-containing protein [Desulfobacteraceae bacterium]|jgi:DnaJ-class molecular chaperone